MKVLLVDNDIQPQTLLARSFEGNKIITVPWNNLKEIRLLDFDCVVLSGSSNFPIVGNENEMSEELDLIRSSPIPILGVCYGFELIVIAFGGTLKIMPKKEQGVLEMIIVKS